MQKGAKLKQKGLSKELLVNFLKEYENPDESKGLNKERDLIVMKHLSYSKIG